MLSIKKGASSYLKQIGRSQVVVRTNVAKKSTSTINIEQNTSNKEDPVDQHASFSNTISFSSPESDFCTSHIRIKSNFNDLDYDHANNQTKEHTSQPIYSDSLSFASPESDFTSGSMAMMYEETVKEDQRDKDTNVAKDTFFKNLEQNQAKQEDLAYSLAFTSAESNFTNPFVDSMLSERQKEQLQNTRFLADLPTHEKANQLSSIVNRHDLDDTESEEKSYYENFKGGINASDEYHELRAHAELLSHEDPLPTNMEEAMLPTDDRAIVITEAEVPFKIVTVNSAWEQLCGFTNDECNGRTLKCIQGPETNEAAITALMSQLLRGEEAGTILVNYKKDGSKFLNRLRVGTLTDDNNSVTHFVGVLKEVKEMTDHFNEASKILVD